MPAARRVCPGEREELVRLRRENRRLEMDLEDAYLANTIEAIHCVHHTLGLDHSDSGCRWPATDAVTRQHPFLWALSPARLDEDPAAKEAHVVVTEEGIDAVKAMIVTGELATAIAAQPISDEALAAPQIVPEALPGVLLEASP